MLNKILFRGFRPQDPRILSLRTNSSLDTPTSVNVHEHKLSRPTKPKISSSRVS